MGNSLDQPNRPITLFHVTAAVILRVLRAAMNQVL